MKTNIVLIGFMGAGKTEVGRILAKNYGFNFIDADSLIEKREEMTISEIFSKKGEKYFRDLETEILKELAFLKKQKRGTDLKSVPFLLSAGGGMPAFNDNMNLLKNIGTVLYLKADPSVIYERIKSETHRPVLGGEGFTPASIAAKLSEREKFYEKADIIIYTDCLTQHAAAEEISIFLNLKNN